MAHWGVAMTYAHQLWEPRLGMWQDSITSNLAATTGAHAQGDVGEELHAMDYLTYAYLQLGRNAEAARTLEDLRTISGLHTDEFKVGYAASAMPVCYAIERRQWIEAARLVSIADTQPQVFAITEWARVIGLARSGKPAAARQEVDRLKTAYEQLRSARDDYWATQVHVQINEALAWVAHAEGKNDEAVKLMRDAADEEDAIEKGPVTAGAIVPAREQLGDLLLELGRPPGSPQGV